MTFRGVAMRKHLMGLAIVLLASGAQAQVETVVVTGSRIGYDSEAPNVTLPQRADHLVTKVRVVCDTRDLEKRRDELRQTLRSMIAEAARTRRPFVRLSRSETEHSVDFTGENASTRCSVANPARRWCGASPMWCDAHGTRPSEDPLVACAPRGASRLVARRRVRRTELHDLREIHPVSSASTTIGEN